MALLNELLNHGLTISKDGAQLLEKKLGNYSESTGELLEKLSSGELKPIAPGKFKGPAHGLEALLKAGNTEGAVKFYEVKSFFVCLFDR